MKFIDLFSGIGGFRLAMERFGHECVFSSEVDRYARQVYKYHWEEPTGDIRKVVAEDIPKNDVLCAGFPCQSFSIAGNRKGFEDTRGTLFFEICRVLESTKPSVVLLENVFGLLSHDNGRTFYRIISALRELGYMGRYQVLNTKDFGLPQNRERVFIIGHLGERGVGREIFPIRTNCESNNVIPALTARYYGAQANGAYLRQISPKGGSQGDRIYDPEGCASTIASSAGGLGAKTGLYRVEDENSKIRIRRLTPLECERVQGFQDGWTKYGLDDDGNKIDISDSQRYKMLGNAVSVPVVEAIVKSL